MRPMSAVTFAADLVETHLTEMLRQPDARSGLISQEPGSQGGDAPGDLPPPIGPVTLPAGSHVLSAISADNRLAHALDLPTCPGQALGPGL